MVTKNAHPAAVHSRPWGRDLCKRHVRPADRTPNLAGMVFVTGQTLDVEVPGLCGLPLGLFPIRPLSCRDRKTRKGSRTGPMQTSKSSMKHRPGESF